MWKIPIEIVNALKEDVDLYMKIGKLTDRQDAICSYIFGILSEPKGLKILNTILIKKRKIDEKLVHDFLTYSLKMKYKIDNGIWSWNEMYDYNIPFEEVKKPSTKYQLPNNF